MGGSGKSLGGQGQAASLGGAPAQWQAACTAGRQVPLADDVAARSFFEAYFQPYGVSSDGDAEGLFTGYYEPEVTGARAPGGAYRYSIYRRPSGLADSRAYLTRAE